MFLPLSSKNHLKAVCTLVFFVGFYERGREIKIGFKQRHLNSLHMSKRHFMIEFRIKGLLFYSGHFVISKGKRSHCLSLLKQQNKRIVFLFGTLEYVSQSFDRHVNYQILIQVSLQKNNILSHALVTFYFLQLFSITALVIESAMCSGDLLQMTKMVEGNK